MSRPALAGFLAGFGLGIAVSWTLEATLAGRGVVSTYLAPVAIVAVLLSAFLRRGKQ